MLPGRPLAMICFKTFGYITMFQGVIYSQDLKLGHYMKIPPRPMFWAQGIASLWSSIVQLAVLYWAFGNIQDICTIHQSGMFSCPNGRIFFSGSIIWGLIGPQRIFLADGIYGQVWYFWILGALLPVLFFFLAKRFPLSQLRYLNAPVLLGGIAYIPPSVISRILSFSKVLIHIF